MGKLLFKILFRFARKFAIKSLELFLAEYAKGRFEYLLSPPKTPDITDFPEISLSVNKENTEDESGNSINKIVKEVSISIGGGVFLLTQLGKNISNSEIKDANRDLDSADEDWNGDILPVFAAVGAGITSVINDIKIPEIKVPDLDLPQIPPYTPLFGDKTDEIKKNYGGGKKSNVDTDKTSTFTGITPIKDWFSGGTRTVQSNNKISVETRNGQTVIKRHGQELRVKKFRTGESFDQLLDGYTYDSKQQSVGATGAFYGSESGRMRKINKIILHCTADPEGRDHTLEYYNTEHLKRDGGTWQGVGYHFIIHPDGTIETARPINMVGSHCKGQNYNSIGIAYIGGMNKEYTTAKDTRTRAQKKQMWRLVLYLLQRFPSATVHGHHEYDPKPCPCFDVKDEFDWLMSHSFDIDGLCDGNTSITEINGSSSQFGDGLGTQKSNITVIKTNGVQ